MENGFLVATDNDMLDGALRLLGVVLPPLGPRPASVAGVLVLYSSSHAYIPFLPPLVSSTLIPQVRRILVAARLAHAFQPLKSISMMIRPPVYRGTGVGRRP